MNSKDKKRPQWSSPQQRTDSASDRKPQHHQALPHADKDVGQGPPPHSRRDHQTQSSQQQNMAQGYRPRMLPPYSAQTARPLRPHMSEPNRLRMTEPHQQSMQSNQFQVGQPNRAQMSQPNRPRMQSNQIHAGHTMSQPNRQHSPSNQAHLAQANRPQASNFGQPQQFSYNNPTLVHSLQTSERHSAAVYEGGSKDNFSNVDGSGSFQPQGYSRKDMEQNDVQQSFRGNQSDNSNQFHYVQPTNKMDQTDHYAGGNWNNADYGGYSESGNYRDPNSSQVCNPDQYGHQGTPGQHNDNFTQVRQLPGPSGHPSQYHSFPNQNMQGQQSVQRQIPLPLLNQEAETFTLPNTGFQNADNKFAQNNVEETPMSHDASGEQEDQKWLTRWIRMKRLETRKKRKSPEISIKIPMIRHLLKQCFNMVAELTKLRDSLADCEEDEQTWTEQNRRAVYLQQELETVQGQLDEDTIKAFKEKVYKARKKRVWRKKRNTVVAEESVEMLVKRQQLHDKIDADLGAKRQKIIDAQKEKEMKAGADKILSEVRKKLLDANKSLDLLKSLKKLRQIRKDSAVRKGTDLFTPADCDAAFESQTQNLIEMMERQKKTYEDEQKTLQVILEMEQQENLEKEQEQLKGFEQQRIRKKQNRNMELLFGKEDVLDEMDSLQPFRNYYLQAEQNYHALLHIRREWDSCLVPDHVIGGSSVPQGWVVPSDPADEVWASALKNKR